MGEKDERGILERFFYKIGETVKKTGEITTSTPVRLRDLARKDREISEGGKGDLSERLQELRRMDEEDEKIQEMLEQEMEMEEKEEREWDRRREELEQPPSDRFADFFFQPFRTPSQKLSGFFSELDEDMNRANMRMQPERYIGMLLGIGSMAGVISFVLFWFLMGSILFSLLFGVVGFIVPLGVGRFYPRQRINSRSNQINQEIPYALRHMATQLSSGIGLPEAMTSVSRSRYGTLSDEFGRAIDEMRRGDSMSEALNRMKIRVDSDFLGRAIRQMQRTLRTGGNLSKTLNILADEASFTMRMNLRNYTQSLNMMSMIYMFAAAVIPPMLIVVLIISNFMGGGLLPPEMMSMAFVVVIPFLLFYLVIIFKRMEPSV